MFHPWVIFIFASLSMFAVQAAELRFVNLEATSVGYNEHTRKLYATVPSIAGLPYGNHLVEIEPLDGSIGASVYVGSEPIAFATSSGAPVGYVGLNGAAAVRRIDLATMTAGLRFALGTGIGPNFAEDIEVMPGAADTVAVALRNFGFSPRHMGVAIYDSGVPRPTITPDHLGSNTIAFTSQPGVLIGYNNETTNFALRDMRVTPSGVNIVRSVQDVISGFGVRIKSAGGVIYTTSGRAVDPVSLQLLGSYPASGAVAIDTTLDLVGFANSAGELKVFHREIYRPFGTIQLTNGSALGDPLDAVSCGPGCFAVLYSLSVLAIVQDVPGLSPIFRNSFE